jgi:hypothetical protein
MLPLRIAGRTATRGSLSCRRQVYAEWKTNHLIKDIVVGGCRSLDYIHPLGWGMLREGGLEVFTLSIVNYC